MANREPRLKDIYNAEDPYSRPNFENIDTVNNVYENPLVKEERMFDYEIGFGYHNEILKSNLNFYLMDFTNEIVSNGQLDNVGQPISGNAGKSVHMGIEMDFEFNPFAGYPDRNWFKGFNLYGNLSLSDNYFKEYVEILGTDSLNNIIYGNDYSGNTIIFSPSVIGNLTLGYNSDFGLNIYISGQYIGKQYLDNSENERKNPSVRELPGYVNKVIKDYFVFNAGISFDVIPAINSVNSKMQKNINTIFKSVELSLKANNILDRLFETSGSVDYTGTPYWIPAADRNFYVNLKIGL
jgi:iron complex outermembrane receptor protein